LVAGGIPIPVFQSWVLATPGLAPLRAWAHPASPDLHPIEVQARDGAPLRGWYIAGQPDRGWVVYLHGNNGTVQRDVAMLRLLHRVSGRSVVAFDYPGYGFTGGRPDFGLIREDAIAEFKALHERAGQGGVILYGQSFGTTVATYVAAREPVRALVLHSPVASAEIEFDFVKSHWPLGIGFLARPLVSPAMSAGMDTLADAPHVHAPLLVIHGDADDFVPFRGGQAVLAAAGSKDKQFLRVPGKSHRNIHLDVPPARGALAAFFREKRDL
jgi:pimeloyl-ACP methyl ester carboxylesterase